MNSYLKIGIVYCVRNILKLLHILPVKKRQILFSAYEGMAYTCNPKYIFESLMETDDTGFKYIWCLNDKNYLPEKYHNCVKTTKFLSFSHIYYLITSGVIISNVGIEPIIPKRKSQIFINTWHGGGAYKRVSFDMGVYTKSEQYYIKCMRSLRRKDTDFFLSSCRKFTDVSSIDFDIESSRFVSCGLPRNDRFFSENEYLRKTLRRKICMEYRLDQYALLVLYAPTYRGTYRMQQQIDRQVCSQRVISAFSERFGRNVIMLFRSHISKNVISESKDTNSDITVVDVTEYPDMQDLLDIADVLITDYSSSIWDYSITQKPGFLYMPDINSYGIERGFYTPLDKWPYPYAENISSFCQLILDYDEEKSHAKIKAHQNLLGSYEQGNSNQIVLRLLKDSL